jgi:aspartyl-tRNA(Asn)/glutamyl-tRNA(Gln) amidotransferase subunit C
MGTISTDDVRQLAALSSISLDEAELESLRVDLENILGYVDQLGQLDTDGVEPTYQVTGLQNVWRSDEIADDTVSTEALLDLAPESQDNQIKVPKVL